MSEKYLVDRKTQLLIAFCVTGRAHDFAMNGRSLSFFTNTVRPSNADSLHIE